MIRCYDAGKKTCSVEFLHSNLERCCKERDDAGPIGHVDDEDFDDESERPELKV